MISTLLALFTIVTFTTSATDIGTSAPFAAQLLVSTIRTPRGLYVDSFGDILVVSSTDSRIYAIRETDHGNGTAAISTRFIVNGTGLGLTHGIAFNNGYLYASSDTTVYRWPYVPGEWPMIAENLTETVITNIEGGHHVTRTLIFDDAGVLYVSVGSGSNIDSDSSRSRIRRFSLQSLPIRYGDGELFADGVRNTVGLAFNSNGVLFGVDNGPDLLNRENLGGEIWPENPGEEMNKFTHAPGTYYGYPYCWTSYNLSGYATPTQFAWPDFMNDGIHTDEWCQNSNNNAPPVLSMPAHSAPLSIEFYNNQNCGVNGSFPCEAVGDAFIAFRGAWHQGVSYGYKVSWYKFDKNTELPTGEVVDVIFAPNAVNSCNTCIRPVNAVFNKAGHLIVTADATNEIYRVAYNTELPRITSYIQYFPGTPDDDTDSGSSKPVLTILLTFIVIANIFLLNH